MHIEHSEPRDRPLDVSAAAIGAVEGQTTADHVPGDRAVRSGSTSGTTPVRGAVAGRAVRRLPLLALVFIAGVVSLGIEMSGPRLMAPYFGTSLFIWANQIGFTLIYLSLGYLIGGRVADRYPTPRVLCALTAVAALATGLIPFISQPVLNWSVTGLNPANPNGSVFVGSLLTVILLFSVPTILLGMVSPYAIRLSMDSIGSAGRSAGSLYALSTTGSILGAFLPVLLLIPAWGVRRTLIAMCIVLLAASFWGLTPRARLAGVIASVLLVPPLLAGLGPLKQIPGLIFYKESLYNYIQVTRDGDGTVRLVLNEGANAIHSIYNPRQILYGPAWYSDYLLTVPYFNSGAAAGQVRRLGIVGLAGGTIARQYTAAYGPIPIDGAELDPAIVAVGRTYFAMTEPNLRVTIADGRTFIRTTQRSYDVVAIDAFQQPYIPFQLTTREFFSEIRARLSSTGILAINTAHTCTDDRLVRTFTNTLYAAGFTNVYTMDIPSSLNTVVVATKAPTSLSTFQQNLAAVPSSSLVSNVAADAVAITKGARAEPGGLVFTDDRAPVEQLTDQLILSYIQNTCY
ncbi:MAG: fused MFS/spermidine synthase [Ktedonobacterales bacterium]|nr:fused MFS/spermidine synthase [Ktedonobacterales bacterium]